MCHTLYPVLLTSAQGPLQIAENGPGPLDEEEKERFHSQGSITGTLNMALEKGVQG